MSDGPQYVPIADPRSPQAAAPAPTPYEFADTWTNHDARAHAALSGFKGVDDLGAFATTHGHLREVAPERIVVIPDAEAGADAWRDFASKLAPKTPAEYGFEQAAKELPGGDPRFATFAAEMLHRNGVPAPLAKQMMAQWNEYAQTEAENEAAFWRVEVKKELDALKREWGSQYGENVEMARRAVRHLNQGGIKIGERELFDSMEHAGVGVSSLYKAFAYFGRKMAEDAFVDGQRGEPREQSYLQRLYPDEYLKDRSRR